MMTLIKSGALEHVKKHVTHWHEHNIGQLYWLKKGMLAIEIEQLQWALTPGAVAWIPAGFRHKATVIGDMQGQTLYLDKALKLAMPSEPRLCAGDNFMLALLQRIADVVTASVQAPNLARLLAVLQDEINLAAIPPLQLFFPKDRRARQVADLLLAQPDSALTQNQLALQTGLSTRTLSRLFKQETGLSFSHWRQQARILKSLELLARGESVYNVAGECGYDNVSAYIAAFRLRFGITPARYYARVNSESERTFSQESIKNESPAKYL